MYLSDVSNRESGVGHLGGSSQRDGLRTKEVERRAGWHDGACFPSPPLEAAALVASERSTRGLLTGVGGARRILGRSEWLLPAVTAHIDATDGQLGSALLFIAVAALPVMPLAGRDYDRLGPRLCRRRLCRRRSAALPPRLRCSTIDKDRGAR